MSTLQLALPGVLGDSAVEWVWRDDFDEVSDVKRFEHTTVMREEVVRAIEPRAGGVYVDATLGGGGHTVALLEAEPKARIVGLDRDPAAIAAAEERLAPVDAVNGIGREIRIGDVARAGKHFGDGKLGALVCHARRTTVCQPLIEPAHGDWG